MKGNGVASMWIGSEVFSRKKEKREEGGLKRKSTRTKKRKRIFQRDRREEDTRFKREEKWQLYHRKRVKERQSHH